MCASDKPNEITGKKAVLQLFLAFKNTKAKSPPRKRVNISIGKGL